MILRLVWGNSYRLCRFRAIAWPNLIFVLVWATLRLWVACAIELILLWNTIITVWRRDSDMRERFSPVLSWLRWGIPHGIREGIEQDLIARLWRFSCLWPIQRRVLLTWYRVFRVTFLFCLLGALPLYYELIVYDFFQTAVIDPLFKHLVSFCAELDLFAHLVE